MNHCGDIGNRVVRETAGHESGGDAELESDAEPPADDQRDSVDRDCEDDVERELFNTGQARCTFIEAAREVAVEACDSRQDSEKRDDGRKSEIHPG